MPVCIVEAKPGGKIRYEWSDGKGGGFYLTGEFLEIEAPHRIVHVERMHLPDPTPDNHVVTTFTKEGEGTLLTLRMTLPSAEVRSAMLATGMEHGMESVLSAPRAHVGVGSMSASEKETETRTRPKVHVSIDVPDLSEGLRFYGRVFGFVEVARPFPTMAVLDANNVTVCMHEKKAGTPSSTASSDHRRYDRHWTPVHLDFHVVDFEDRKSVV